MSKPRCRFTIWDNVACVEAEKDGRKALGINIEDACKELDIIIRTSSMKVSESAILCSLVQIVRKTQIKL